MRSTQCHGEGQPPPEISVPRKQRWEGCECQASLGYTVRPCLEEQLCCYVETRPTTALETSKSTVPEQSHGAHYEDHISRECQCGNCLQLPAFPAQAPAKTSGRKSKEATKPLNSILLRFERQICHMGLLLLCLDLWPYQMALFLKGHGEDRASTKEVLGVHSLACLCLLGFLMPLGPPPHTNTKPKA